MQVCPNEETFDAFVEGRLDRDSRLALEAHLESCASCNALMVQLLSRPTGTDRLETAPRAGAGRLPVRRQIKEHEEGARLGRYLILHKIGSGGMGTVYAAYDTQLERKVALKFLADQGSEAGLQRLRAEAAAMAKLNHPNVVTIYDAGQENDEAFIAMEFVPGETLGAWRERQPRTIAEIVAMTAAAARGLAAAHAAGIVHRDFKPANILVHGSRVQVTDFGLSVTDGGQGEVTGTPAYMAPEQFEGKAVDARTDVFAFCATLYQMLYGQLPFAGGTLRELARAVCEGRIAPPPFGTKVPAHLHDLVMRGLAADPAARPGDMTAVAKTLLFDPTRARRRRLRAASAAAALLFAVAGSAYFITHPERSCRAGARAMEQVWNDEQRAALEVRYGAIGEGGAWTALQRRIDAHVDAWRQLHGETCAATFGDRRQSETLLDVRMVCLDARRTRLGAFVTALTSASPRELVSATSAPLPDLAACSPSAGRGKNLPLDPAVRARAVAVQNQIATSQARWNLGDAQGSATFATGALAGARALGHEPVLAEALLQMGAVELRRGSPEQTEGGGTKAASTAAPLLEEAIAVAERAGDDFTRAAAAVRLMDTYSESDRLAEGQLWYALASAMLGRAGDPPGERGLLAYTFGWQKLRQDERDVARTLFQQALTLQIRAHGPDAPELLRPKAGLCEVEPRARQLSCQRETLAFGERVLGPNHPNLASLINSMAYSLSLSRQSHAEACQLLRRAVSLLEAYSAPGSRRTISALTNLARCLVEEGRLEEPRRIFTDLLARATKLPSVRASVHVGLIDLHTADADYAAAERHARLALAERRGLLGATNDLTLDAWQMLARSLRLGGRSLAALAETDRAVAACAAARATPSMLAAVLLERGAALRALRQPAQAQRAYQEAQVLLDKQEASPTDRAAALVGLGLARHEAGQRARARHHLEQALALRSDPETPHAEHAEAALALARVLGAGGGKGTAADQARAQTLAAQAVAGFRDAGKRHAADLHAAEALLARLQRRS